MTLDEAILHCQDVAEMKMQDGVNTECYQCGYEHLQLAEWLKELKRDRRILANLYNELSAIKINCEKVKDAI